MNPSTRRKLNFAAGMSLLLGLVVYSLKSEFRPAWFILLLLGVILQIRASFRIMTPDAVGWRRWVAAKIRRASLKLAAELALGVIMGGVLAWFVVGALLEDASRLRVTLMTVALTFAGAVWVWRRFRSEMRVLYDEYVEDRDGGHDEQ